MKKSFLKRRIIAGLLAGVMILSSLSGCGLNVGNDAADAEVETPVDADGNPIEDPRAAADRMEAYEHPEEVYENPMTVEGYDEYTDLSVTVTADESIMNGAESVYIEHVYDSVDAWQAMVDGIEDDAVSREVLAVFDISLLNDSRDRIEPDDSVIVSFSGQMIADAIADEKKLELYHLPNREKTELDGSSVDSTVVLDEEDAAMGDDGYEEEIPTEEEDEAGMFIESDDELSDTAAAEDDEEMHDEIPAEDADGTDKGDAVYSVSSNSVEETSEEESEEPKGLVYESMIRTMSDVPAEEAADAVDRIYPQLVDDYTVIFDTKSFSEYALVLREDSKTQVETPLFGDDEFFESDKYLKVNANEINGQSSATITIEQAYYTDTRVALEKAPARNDILIAMDASGSMSGRTQLENGYILSFLYNVMLTNQERLQKARNNEYADFRYTGNEAALEAFMKKHYMYIDGTLTFNNRVFTTHANTPMLIKTWRDVTSLLSCDCRSGVGCGREHYPDGVYDPKVPIVWECHFSGPMRLTNTYIDGSDKPGVCQSMTRTDLATERLYNWAVELNNRYANQDTQISVLLTTDGAPYGYGSAGNIIAMPDERLACGQTTNAALVWSRKLKDLGVTVYTGYDGQGSGKREAVNSLKNTDDQFRLSSSQIYFNGRGSDTSDLLFMSVYSSDFRWGGTFDLLNPNDAAVGILNGLTINTVNNDVKIRITGRNGATLQYGAGSAGYIQNVNGNTLGFPFKISSTDGITEEYNTFCKYVWMLSDSANDNVAAMQEACRRMNYEAVLKTNKNDTGYASYESYIYDEITDPFYITDVADVRVYKVPRIPKNIDPVTGVPEWLDQSKGCNDEVSEIQLLDDNDFRWGERTITEIDPDADPNSENIMITRSEWTDITDQVTIDAGLLSQNIVKVSGIDYEKGWSVRNYDIDYVKDKKIAGDNGEGLVYTDGDYGYKIVVEIPIASYRSFGGNNIKTNNTDVSGFYPSKPRWQEGSEDARKRPEWIDNTEKNPHGNKYIALYPECKMNLKLNYDIVNDDAVLYAPEMKAMHDLITDKNNSLFYVDDEYAETQTLIASAEGELAMLQEAFKEGEGSDAERQEQANKIVVKKQELSELNEKFNNLNAYVPDGKNNMFVDIDYTLTAPSEETVATFRIPHGTAYTVNSEGKPSIDWEITGGRDVTVALNDNASADITYETFRALVESGEYKVSCEVTPVATAKSPTWHNDSTYPPTEFTPTGSSGIDAGSSSTEGDREPATEPLNLSKTSEVKIFVLQMEADDTKGEKDVRVDVNEGFIESINVPLTDMATVNGKIMRDPVTGFYDTTADKTTHISGFKWVCLDGVTESDEDNEPKGNESVLVSTVVPQAAIDDGLVKIVDGTAFVNAEDGNYIPLITLLTRTYRCVNKGWDANEFIMGMPVDTDAGMNEYGRYPIPNMNKADALYTEGSTVSWKHICEWSDTCNHSDGELADANNRYSSDVQYLIHVFTNVAPDIHKKVTEGNSIFPTGTFKWTVTVSNKDVAKNKDKVISTYSLVDILPHENDERHTDMYNNGTQVHGIMKYSSISADLSKAPSAKKMLEDGKAKIYYTSDIDVYKYPKSRTSKNVMEDIEWKEGTFGINGDTVVFSGLGADPVYAFRFDTRLAFGEEIEVYLEADTINSFDKQPGDVAINQAYVYVGDGFLGSEHVPIEVGSLSISGRIWIDEDFDQLISAGEKGVPGISVGLYRQKAAASDQIAKTVRTYTLPDGTTLELVTAYNTENDRVANVDTDDDGNYSFTNLRPGTYCIIADGLPDGFENVVKNAAGSRNDSTDDSEAEVYYLDNGTNLYLDNSAIIREVVLGATNAETDQQIKGMNVGIQQVNGEITVGKAVRTFKIPNTLTDDDRAVFKGAVVFTFHHVETGVDYTKELFLGEQTYMTVDGEPQVWGTVDGLPLGTYIVSETEFKENNDVDVHTQDPNVYTVGSSVGTENGIARNQAVVKLTYDDTDAKLWFENELMDHTTGSYNHAYMRIPVKLEIKYIGPDPVGNTDMKTYVFKREEFEDMIVTYDDGTQISLKEGTLRFEDVVLTPGSSANPITRKMNTGKNGKPITVTGYYSEKGRLVKDSFKVRVTLKDLHKFTAYFDCNYTAGEGGTGFVNGGYNLNAVAFLYDEDTGEVEVTSGIYKDTKNGKLTAPHYAKPNADRSMNTAFWQAGWNNKIDGSGKQFEFKATDADNIDSVLSAMGAAILDPHDSAGDGMVWYANWRGTAGFNANGTYDPFSANTIANAGFLVSTRTDDAGADLGTARDVTYNKNQKIFLPDFVGKVSNPAQEAAYDHWNESPWNVAGKDLRAGTRTFQGGEQFYAIYYTTEFKFIGRGDAFIAPTDGTYTFKLWGSPGGIPHNYRGFVFNTTKSKGGYTEVSVPLKRNQKIFCFVGSAGAPAHGFIQGGYNGGGATDPHLGTHSASGGGATHISWSHNPIYSDTIDRNPAGGVLTRSMGTGTIGAYLHYTHRWDNTQDVIAVAGGAGGDGLKEPDHPNLHYQLFSYGGGNIASPPVHASNSDNRADDNNYPHMPAANNNTGAGYTRGAGQAGIGESGGGGGWCSGYSQSKRPACFASGGGGTSYIRRDYTGFTIAGNDVRIIVYQKPVTEGRNGYIKATKN